MRGSGKLRFAPTLDGLAKTNKEGLSMGMKRTSRTWKSVALIVFIATFVVGCTSGGDDPNSATPNGGGSADGGSNVNATGFPIAKNKITMSAFAPQSANIADLNTNWFTKYLEEKTNVHLNWQLVPGEAAALKEKNSYCWQVATILIFSCQGSYKRRATALRSTRRFASSE